MADACSNRIPKPARRSMRWTSFVGTPSRGRTTRGLQEEGNPEHRVRVEHNKDTLLVHISDEDGKGWTTLAIDRVTREWSIAQRERQLESAKAAVRNLYESGGTPSSVDADRADGNLKKHDSRRS